LAGGGSLLQIGVHLFDTIRFLTGDEASWVWCQTLRVKNPALEDVSSAVFELRSTGVLCTVETSKVSRGRTGLITVVGDKGQLVADLIQTTLQRIVGRRAWQLAVRGQIHTLVGVLEDFVRSVRRGLEPPITGLDGLQAVRLAEACRRSASEGRIIRLRA
jgi:myo-inositol 2-dehydrogenase/D-chiro-inositol 1-dehydrogenase